MKYRQINLNGKVLAYQEAGQGVPVLMLHGWPQSSHVWRKVTPLISPRHRVILIDLPGLGESQGFGAYDTGSVADLIAGAARQLGIARYHLVGHDVGAWVAASLALRHPSQLESLTVVDAGIPGLMPDELFKPANAARVWQFYFHAVADIPELLTRGREQEYLSWYFHNKTVVKDAFTEHDIALYVEQYRREGAMSNGFGYYRAFTASAEQNRAFQGKLTLPVLAIGGESGVGASLGVAMRKVATDVTATVLANCGHYVPEERPQDFAQALLAFFARRNSS
jgi:pimeloyl-ACP methyl ester carboxylesterase